MVDYNVAHAWRSLRPPPPADQSCMIGSEASPFSKTGGLADVLGALPPALARLGWRRHGRHCRDIAASTAGESREHVLDGIGADHAEVSFYEATAWRRRYARCSSTAPGSSIARALRLRQLRLSRQPAPLRGAGRGRARKRRSSAASGPTSSTRTTGRRAGAGLPADAATRRSDAGRRRRRCSRFTTSRTRAVFDAATGCRARSAAGDLYTLRRLEFWGSVSFLKAGINSATNHDGEPDLRAGDPDTGIRLRLRRRPARAAADLVGILNGIDTEPWNPARRPVPAGAFRRRQLSGRSARRSARCCERGLPRTRRRWRARSSAWCRGWSTRRARSDRRGRATSCRSSTRRSWCSAPASRGTRTCGGARGAVSRTGSASRIGFDEGLAHLIEAGADMFLMPSRFEPCGLNQMYSLRYGTVPIVRAAGGLDDTVTDYDAAAAMRPGSSSEDTAGGAAGHVRRALRVFATTPTPGGRCSGAAWRQDFSWDRSARRICQSV